MNTRAGLWGFLGVIPGLKEIALLAVVVLVLYGRSGLQVARRGGGLPPWLSPVRRTAASAARARAQAEARTQTQKGVGAESPRRGDRLFWFLAIVAATAVGAWVVTRTFIVSAPRLAQ
jgi:hypothetical protein